MSANLTDSDTLGAAWLYFIAPLVLIVAIYASRRLRALRVSNARLIWIVAIAEVTLYVAAGYSLGLLLEGIVTGVGLDWQFVMDGELPKLTTQIAVFMGVARLVEVWLLSLDPSNKRHSMSRLTRTLLYGMGLLLGALAFLIAHGYTFLSISTGALAAMLAFAMQRSMGDLIAGVAMSLEGAFQIGEWIRLEDGTEAEIVDIDWRATHLKGWDRAVMVIPNATLASQALVKLPRKQSAYAQSYQLSISGAQDPEDVKRLLTDAANQADGVLSRPAPVIRLADISHDPYQYSLWVHFENYMAMFAGRDALFSNIHAGLKDAGYAISPEVIDLRSTKMEAHETNGNRDHDPPT